MILERSNARRSAAAAMTKATRFGDVVIIAFLLSQALDGVFTYVGVQKFGVGIEANPLIYGMMPIIGKGAAVALAKLFAAMLGIALHVTGVHRTVALLTAIYFGAAVLPWAALLFGS